MDQLKAAFQGFPHPRSFLDFAANEARRLDSTTMLLFAGFVTVILAVFASQLLVIWQFVWNCFLQPLGKQADQAGRLNRFYSGQAESPSFPPTPALLQSLTPFSRQFTTRRVRSSYVVAERCSNSPLRICGNNDARIPRSDSSGSISVVVPVRRPNSLSGNLLISPRF